MVSTKLSSGLGRLGVGSSAGAAGCGAGAGGALGVCEGSGTAARAQARARAIAGADLIAGIIWKRGAGGFSGRHLGGGREQRAAGAIVDRDHELMALLAQLEAGRVGEELVAARRLLGADRDRHHR